MTVAIAEFKQAARRFGTDVTIVTARDGSDIHGIVVSAFVVLSLEPPLVLVSIHPDSRLYRLIGAAGAFAVSVLGEEQYDVARLFATPGRPVEYETFTDVACVTKLTGAPVIEGCLSYFDCRVAASYAGGDHMLVLGEVLEVGYSTGSPLLYFDRKFRGIRDL